MVLDFWATWCGPCKMSMPWLQEFNKGKGETGACMVELISVNVWERVTGDERMNLVKESAAEHGLSWKVMLAENSAASDFEVRGVPTFVVIDKEGVIRYKISGYNAFLDEILTWMVEDVM